MRAGLGEGHGPEYRGLCVGWVLGEARTPGGARMDMWGGEGHSSQRGGSGGEGLRQPCRWPRWGRGGQQEDEGAPSWRDRQGWAWGLSKREGQGGRRGRHSRRGHRVALWEDPSRSPPQPSPLALRPLPRVRLPAGA